jgi:hypothetical protein
MTPFAMALFFAGISAELHPLPARASILTLGCVVFLGTLIWIATVPVMLTG